MKSAIFLITVAAFAAPREPRSRELETKALLAQPPIHWLKMYPLSPYKEFWSLALNVDDLEKSLPNILDVFEKNGATLTQPLATFPASAAHKVQQLSCRISDKNTKRIIAALKKLGRLSEPSTRPAAEAVSLPEVKEKINKLSSEQNAHAAELAAMPAISALTQELLEHLLMVETLLSRSDSEVLLNLTVQGVP